MSSPARAGLATVVEGSLDRPAGNRREGPSGHSRAELVKDLRCSRAREPVHCE